MTLLNSLGISRICLDLNRVLRGRSIYINELEAHLEGGLQGVRGIRQDTLIGTYHMPNSGDISPVALLLAENQNRTLTS